MPKIREKKEWILEVRFIVVAETDLKATNILYDFLPETNKDIPEYKLISKPKERKTLLSKLKGVLE